MNENSNSKFVLYCLLWVHPVFFDQTGCRRSKANRPLAVECCFKTTALRKSSIGGIAAPQSFNRKYGMLPASSGFLPAIENPRHDAAGTASGRARRLSLGLYCCPLPHPGRQWDSAWAHRMSFALANASVCVRNFEGAPRACRSRRGCRGTPRHAKFCRAQRVRAASVQDLGGHATEFRLEVLPLCD